MDSRAAKRRRAGIPSWIIVAALTSTAAHADAGATWRIQWDNDGVFHSDNQFTNGFSVQKHGAVAREWPQVGGTFAFGKRMAGRLLPRSQDGLQFREGWSIGQDLQTPEDLSRKDPIADDVPYGALLAVENTWVAFDDRRLYGFGWLYGVVGPAALGKPVQQGMHTLLGADTPEGWSNQLRNELTLNLYYDRKQKLARVPWGDLALGGSASLGNLFTGASVSLEARLGRHPPAGFVHLPDPLGFGLSHEASEAPRDRSQTALYASLVVRQTVLGYSVFYNGNLLHDGPNVEHETLVGSAILGLHYERPRWGIHLNVLLSGDTVDPGVARSEPDTTLNYGTVTLDFRR
jgi:hypothetical protein